MTQPNLVSDPTPGSSGGTPADQGKGVQPGSEGVVSVPKAEWDATQKALKELTATVNHIKSDDDRGVNKAVKLSEKATSDVQALYARFEEMREKGLSPEQAAQAIEGQVQLDKIAQDLNQYNQEKAQRTVQEQTKKVLDEFELSDKDADTAAKLTEVLAENPNPDRLRAEMAAFAYEKSRKIPPTGAQGPAPLTPIIPEGETNPKIERYAELSKHPSKNRDELKKLKAELDAEGWGAPQTA